MQIIRNLNVHIIIIEVIGAPYKGASSAVLINNDVGQFFRIVGVQQGCILSLVLSLFFFYPEKGVGQSSN